MENREYEPPFNPKAWASGRVVGYQRCRRFSAADGSGLNGVTDINPTGKFLDIATGVSTRTQTHSAVKSNRIVVYR